MYKLFDSEIYRNVVNFLVILQITRNPIACMLSENQK